jgi:O-Antigen ligase
VISWSNQSRRWAALVAAAPPAAETLGFTLTALTVVGFAASSGGFYPTAWGWGALAALGVALVALLTERRFGLARRDWLMLGTGLALLAWMAVTALRPDLPTRAVPQLERAGLYLAVLWAGLLVMRRRSVGACLAGLWAGIVATSCFGLATQLFPGGSAPNVFEGRLLDRPLGYANAVGILAGLGVILAVGLAAQASRLAIRVVAAATLVPLIATVAFTESRGSEAALVIGLATLIVLSTGRRVVAATLVVTLPLPLLGAWVGLRSHVGDGQATPALVAHDGRVVAGLLALLTTSAVLIARVALRDGGLVRREGRHSGAALWGLAAGASALLIALLLRGSGSLGDRSAYWHAALVDYRSHPVLGSGAGSFAVAWLRYRATPVTVLNAHSLYLETLAEIGPVGLALLVVTLALPLTAVASALRAGDLAAPAAGVYVAYLGHAAIDWDWQMPAVTASALVAAVAILVLARQPQADGQRATQSRLAAATAVTLAFAVAAAAGLAGNIALADAAAATKAGSLYEAQRSAERAARWQPWSAEPQLLLGEIQLASGDRVAARRSLTHALRLDAQDWRTWAELARATPSRSPAALRAIARLNPLAVEPLTSTPHA